MAESGVHGAAALLSIRNHMSRPIATIVILNNVANIVGSITVGGIAASVLGNQWLGLFSAVLTFLVIVFAEIVPKTLGQRYAGPIALAAAQPVRLLAYLMTPIVWGLERITAPLTGGRALPTTDEAEIRLLAQIGLKEGNIGANESEMIQRIFLLNDLRAADLMTPRVALTTLHAEQSLADATSEIIGSPHSRIIVTGDSPDTVFGFALKNDLLTAIVEGKTDQPVRTFIRDVHFVPQYVPADRLLEQFRTSRQHLVVVIDEFGGVAGVVTLEDVVETLTGTIVDETDVTGDLRAAARRRSVRLLQPAGE